MAAATALRNFQVVQITDKANENTDKRTRCIIDAQKLVSCRRIKISSIFQETRFFVSPFR